METIKCITFDKKAQDNLPEHIKAKMKVDREQAEREQEEQIKNCTHEFISREFLDQPYGTCAVCGRTIQRV